MRRYVLRRLLQFVPVLLGATFLIYAMMWALPGDPLAGRCGDRACPQSYVDRMTEAYNLSDPLVVQYVKYMAGVFTGDLGTTFAGVPVADELLSRLPLTAQLAGLAIVFEIILGVTAGVLAALRPGGLLDSAILVSTLIVVAIPMFVLALLGQSFFGVELGWFPVTSDGSLLSLILPAVVLGSVSVAVVARVMRSSMIASLQADHVRTAQAKGLAPRRVVVAHGVRNSLIPVTTLVGADLGVLLGGTVVVEMIFNINGIGDLLLRSVGDGEIGTVTATVTMLVLAFLIINLVVDLLYPLLDPRIRHE
ncbi:ABC transporter permease [Actinobacteria bacterium YIM 96077]|uniref:ABC transporter permease n=1 Tax=Phytoactinopolyspora halophila TaxID=1981511 RepID=A0A329QR80_9ACTN|nr:ABC transporter permease [Phytoactinopolyspora halophila]AYY14321.1 ABC transporter permease [Actinobacteria bacterium YIM 96077]RAW14864.1 ABC transporter permease [Phytoactinopolyspora halophila]